MHLFKAHFLSYNLSRINKFKVVLRPKMICGAKKNIYQAFKMTSLSYTPSPYQIYPCPYILGILTKCFQMNAQQ
jgi:hypothetical protein